jgi:hypothetical protein
MILDHQRVAAECCPITSPNLSLLQFASLMDKGTVEANMNIYRLQQL